jgi:hypothetical protein
VRRAPLTGMTRTFCIALATLLLLTATGAARADDRGGPASSREWSSALDQLDRRLAHYVDWRRIPALREMLQERREAYLTQPTTETFLSALNADLYATSHDRHLQVWVEPRSRDEPVAQPGAGAGEPQPDFGLRTVRREGPIGFLELTQISGDAAGADAVDHAMERLRGAEVLILDLRNNGGGGEAVQRRLLGHLAPSPLPLEEIRFRHCEPDPADPEGCVQDGRIDIETRTADVVAHPAFPTQAIYILTSKQTFSAAEAIAYNLQASRRAVVVGERTGGGANPSAGMDLGRWFTVVMPIATTVLPATGTNWEGSGVQPDVLAEPALAMNVALSLAADQSRRPRPKTE